MGRRGGGGGVLAEKGAQGLVRGWGGWSLDLFFLLFFGKQEKEGPGHCRSPIGCLKGHLQGSLFAILSHWVFLLGTLFGWL